MLLLAGRMSSGTGRMSSGSSRLTVLPASQQTSMPRRSVLIAATSMDVGVKLFS